MAKITATLATNTREMKTREIKFRAWDGIRMTTSGIMFNTSTGCVEVPTQGSFNSEISDKNKFVLMQFTGLKDKNGEDIYEGDVVRFYIFPDGPTPSVSSVGFSNASFTLANKTLGDFKEPFIEVIGNVFENPELANSSHL